jgi:hypothetical protein
MRNLTMLSLPLQLVFLVLSHPPSGFRGLIELKVSDLAKQVFRAFHGKRFGQKQFFLTKQPILFNIQLTCEKHHSLS